MHRIFQVDLRSSGRTEKEKLMCCFRHLTVRFACFTLVLPVWAWGQCYCGSGAGSQGCGRGTPKPGWCCSADEVRGGTSCDATMPEEQGHGCSCELRLAFTSDIEAGVCVQGELGNPWPPVRSVSIARLDSSLKPAPFASLAKGNNCRQALLGRWLK
jgi:hypothetical protein